MTEFVAGIIIGFVLGIAFIFVLGFIGWAKERIDREDKLSRTEQYRKSYFNGVIKKTL